MQLYFWDPKGIIRRNRLAYVMKRMRPGILGITITIYQDENENYYVHYETNVVRINVDPDLFVVKVRFVPRIEEQWKKIAVIGLSDVDIVAIDALRRPLRRRRRSK